MYVWRSEGLWGDHHTAEVHGYGLRGAARREGGRGAEEQGRKRGKVGKEGRQGIKGGRECWKVMECGFKEIYNGEETLRVALARGAECLASGRAGRGEKR